MDNGVTDPIEADDGVIISAETQAVLDAAAANSEGPKDPLAVKTTPAPEGVPEKFWDPIAGKLRTDDLVKAYGELEKKLGAPADPAPDPDPDADPAPDPDPGVDPDADPDPDPDADPAPEAPALADAVEAARLAYAETGELGEEQRKPLIDAGISNEQIDLYLAGVAAVEKTLEAAATEPFGGSRQAFDQATAWAKDNWSEKQIAAFNAAMSDPGTAKIAAAGLHADFSKANPGEGSLTNINSGTTRGDVYTSMADFQEDLRKADAIRDSNARNKALEKLRRSRQAKSIK